MGIHIDNKELIVIGMAISFISGVVFAALIIRYFYFLN